MAEITDKQKQELQELVSLLGSIKGMHTELVTVLIPSGTNIYQVSNQLSAEASTAENIKSKQTRTSVVTALEMIIRKLKEYKQTPPNGLALFCGNVSEKEGGQDIQIWAYEPPKPLNVRIYRCDKVFVIEPLKEMLEVDEVFGLLVIDRQGATIGVLEGKQIKVIRTFTSGVPGKVRAGGQCLSPDTLVTKEDGKLIEIKDIQIGDKIKAFDLKNKQIIFTECLNKWKKTKNKYLIITSNNELKNFFLCSEDHLVFIEKDDQFVEMPAKSLRLTDKIINTSWDNTDNNFSTVGIIDIKQVSKSLDLIDIETKCGNFFADKFLVHNSAQRYHRVTEGLAKEFFRRVADSMKEIFFDMPKLKGILIGGPIPTKEDFIDEGDLVTKLKEKIIAVKDVGYTDEHGLELLVEQSWEDIAQQELIKEKKILTSFFEALGKRREKTTYGYEKTKAALERGAVELLLISDKLPKEQIKELESLAENSGTEVVIIGTENQDGEQFLNLTKGTGAILRFQIDFE
jgi:peptide subunit release factor 1 (eRF1)